MSTLASSFLQYQEIYGKRASAKVGAAIEEIDLPESELMKILEMGKPPDETEAILEKETALDGESLFGE